ncbi:MazG nucleotide pyrophosphohydrolase domain-containing protein [Thermoflavimicrobium dichotomicum]|uniref:NTP pyrophosphatase, house-cleaning of non-canonical NTPs n=1 Tax=Thermoflavimicrobium dichotomicum TaxID=46223 RepID=A0A1I3U945_9BACL|nr:MazG nucleotide pyrophosphohydrolase domain-containing protein [Thermoflavimicrobium dichotomicum]SFJ78307.1 NTP pyrophosphatase, house-cleaning of non-canonical NTPs [Thermoflavimicrobium dichotomicum]
MLRIKELQEQVKQLLDEKGFRYDKGVFWEKIALTHTEISELADVIKKQGYDAREKIAEEIADIIIRAMNFGLMFDIDVEEAIKKKMEFNFTRPRKYNTYEGKSDNGV